MNYHAIKAIYRTEMTRMMRTVVQSIVAPVLSTSLYFVIFGAAIGSRITEIDGVSYGAFIVPGLIMLSIMTESISNSSFAIYFPKFTGTIFELLSAPIFLCRSAAGIRRGRGDQVGHHRFDHIGDGEFFVTIEIAHPAVMLLFLVLTCIVQPVRIYPRRLGRRLGETDDCADSRHHAADVPRWHVLLDQHAATGLADD